MSKAKPIRKMPSVELLREFFAYDPITGELYWKTRARHHFETHKGWAIWNGKNAGQRAGNVNSNGHRRVVIKPHFYLEHRIIWKLMTGDEPRETIDHRDGNRANNVWSNLRLASQTEQHWNAKIRKDNKSGYRGVSPSGDRWAVRIGMHGRYQHIGCFGTAEEAAAAYESIARELHGEFYRETKK